MEATGPESFSSTGSTACFANLRSAAAKLEVRVALSAKLVWPGFVAAGCRGGGLPPGGGKPESDNTCSWPDGDDPPLLVSSGGGGRTIQLYLRISTGTRMRS